MPAELAQPLHPEAVAMLDAQRQAGVKPRSEMTVDETRQALMAGRGWQLDPPAVPVRDTVANGVPVRLYGPESAEALLFLHGGRFFSGDLESHDWPLRIWHHWRSAGSAPWITGSLRSIDTRRRSRTR